MVTLIEKMRKDQDSIGGVAEIVARNVPAGLGEPVFDKLKADLGKACSAFLPCWASSTALASRWRGRAAARTTTRSRPTPRA